MQMIFQKTEVFSLKKLVFIFAVLAAVLSGCIAEEPENSVWERNPTEHWINGKNGEKLNVGEHELDEESFCEICGCEIFDHGNGVITVSNYDEKGNPVRVTNFAFGGNSAPKDLDTALVQQEVIREVDGTIRLGQLTMIPVSISSMERQNTFQPTPYEKDSEEYLRTVSKLDGTFTGPNLQVDYDK